MQQKIILGPPGTGKTRRLMELLGYELTNIHPSQIAYVSFTKEGAYTGAQRAMEKFKYKKDDFPYFKTLHSIAFNQCNYTVGNVMKGKDYANLGKGLGLNFKGFASGDMRSEDDQYLFFIDTHKNNARAAAPLLNDLNTVKLRYIASNLARFKAQYNLVTFTDMISEFCERNQPLPVKVAFVDEAQDLTSLQWKMVLIAFRDCERIYIAGDDDQAIYQWSGADINYFLNLQGDIEILNRSYRLPTKILSFSQKIALQINNRVHKDVMGRKAHGTVAYINHVRDIRKTILDNKEESWMFLARNQYHLEEVLEFLTFAGIPYINKGNTSVKKKDIEAINAYERVRAKKDYTQKEHALARSYVPQGCDFKKPWYEEMIEISMLKRNYYRGILANGYDSSKVTVRVDTIHSVKGGEADNVVLLTDMTKSVHNNMGINSDAELRVFYVGCTRSRKRLFLVYPTGRYYYDFIGMGK